MKKFIEWQVSLTFLFLATVLLIPLTSWGSQWYQWVAIQSNSMADSMPMGSVVLVVGADEYHLDEIIAFKQQGALVLHRLKEIHRESDQTYYLVASETQPDQLVVVFPSQVVGKVRWIIPKLGFILGWVSGDVLPVAADLPLPSPTSQVAGVQTLVEPSPSSSPSLSPLPLAASAGLTVLAKDDNYLTLSLIDETVKKSWLTLTLSESEIKVDDWVDQSEQIIFKDEDLLLIKTQLEHGYVGIGQLDQTSFEIIKWWLAKF